MENTALKIKVDEATKLTVAVVTNQEDLNHAKEKRKVINGLIKEVEGFMEPVIKATHTAWKKAIGQKDSYVKPLKEAKGVVSLAIDQYLDEQERIKQEAVKKAQEEQRIAEEKARKTEEAAYKKELEAIRLREMAEKADAEEKEKLEALARKAEIEAKKADTRSENADIALQIDSNLTELAENRREPDTEGMTRRKNLEVEVFNSALLIEAIARKEIPEGIVKAFDITKLKNLIKGGATDIPGVSYRWVKKSH